MTYTSTIKTGKLSVWVLNNVHNQTTSSTTYVDYQLDSGSLSVVDQFSSSISISTTDHRVTLPAGKYYLNARLYVSRASTATWGAEYIFYNYASSTKNEIGYAGKEIGAIAIGDPQKAEHAVAYIESDGTAEIGLQYKSINGQLIEVSDTTYVTYSGQSRIMIWRIE